MQIVGDERVRRAEPHLVDRGRLLQQRQRRLGPTPAQIQIAQLRQAARGLRRLGSVSAPVEGQRFVEALPGLLEALQRGKRGAERPQRFGRSRARVAPGAFDRASGPGERRVGIAAGERHPRQPGENLRVSTPILLPAHPPALPNASRRRRSAAARRRASGGDRYGPAPMPPLPAPSPATPGRTRQARCRSARRRRTVACARSPARLLVVRRRVERRQQGGAVRVLGHRRRAECLGEPVRRVDIVPPASGMAIAVRNRTYRGSGEHR